MGIQAAERESDERATALVDLRQALSEQASGDVQNDAGVVSRASQRA